MCSVFHLDSTAEFEETCLPTDESILIDGLDCRMIKWFLINGVIISFAVWMLEGNTSEQLCVILFHQQLETTSNYSL